MKASDPGTMPSPVKKKRKYSKRGSVKFKQFILACETLSLMYGFEGERGKIQWDYKKNDVLPEHVAKASNKEFWFYCPKCEHSYPKRLSDITGQKLGCGYCSGHVRCKDKDCKHCYTTSFANAAVKYGKDKDHKDHIAYMISNWSDTNVDHLKPWMVAANDTKKYWFDCEKCGHTHDMSPNMIVSKGTGCGYCCPSSKRFCGDAACAHCWDRSVAGNPKKQAVWDVEANRANGHEAHTTARCCNKKFVWTCPEQDKDGTFHTFQMTANHVANGHGCPECKHKTEKKVKDFLRTQLGTTLIGAQLLDETSFDWCKNIQNLPFDIVLVLADGTKIIIEVDGPQHYDDKHYFSKKTKHDIPKRDRYKEKRALKHGYSLIRLKQVDVWKDTTDWKAKLLDAISLCQNFNKNIVVKTY